MKYNEVSLSNVTQSDGCIDRMVYGLYGLTKEEIALVEKEIGGKFERKEVSNE